MGAVKQSLMDQEAMMGLALIRDRAAYRNMAYRMQAALNLIVGMTPDSIGQPDDAWGKVECFHEMKKVARQTLDAIAKEYGDGSV